MTPTRRASSARRQPDRGWPPPLAVGQPLDAHLAEHAVQRPLVTGLDRPALDISARLPPAAHVARARHADRADPQTTRVTAPDLRPRSATPAPHAQAPSASSPPSHPTISSNCSRERSNRRQTRHLAPVPDPPRRQDSLHQHPQPALRAGVHQPASKVPRNGCRGRRSRRPPPSGRRRYQQRRLSAPSLRSPPTFAPAAGETPERPPPNRAFPPRSAANPGAHRPSRGEPHPLHCCRQLVVDTRGANDRPRRAAPRFRGWPLLRSGSAHSLRCSGWSAPRARLC